MNSPLFPPQIQNKALGYSPQVEEVPMTLQVGLVGRDGAVLAGDKQIITKDAYATTSLSSKIKLDRENRLAIAWSCDDVAETIADRILRESQVLGDGPALRDLAERVYRERYPEIFEDSPPKSNGKRGELLAVSQDRISEILYLEIDALHCITRQIENKIFAGHIVNPSCYLVERYYSKVSVKELVSLAAHTILAAGRINPMGIKGLEIFTCTANGIERIPDPKIESLTQHAEETDQEIRRLLLA
jgi:hypothetical protein